LGGGEYEEEHDGLVSFLPHKDVPDGEVHFHHPTPATLVLERERERERELNTIYSDN
jgi:hypothetical protein